MPFYLSRQAIAGGGGGGGGRTNNLAVGGGAFGIRVRGAVRTIGNINVLRDAVAGGTGVLSSQGGGGFRGEEVDPGDCHALGGDGGSGGFYGAAGGSGTAGLYQFPGNGPVSGGGAGGAGGLAVFGNSNITWGATGERYGGIIG